MALVEVKPSRIDTAIADTIADHTNSGVEHTAQTLTWAADEHVLLALAAWGGSTLIFGSRNSAPLQITFWPCRW